MQNDRVIQFSEVPCDVKGSFSESPSQGFREKNSSFAPLATLRLSFPYSHKRSSLCQPLWRANTQPPPASHTPCYGCGTGLRHRPYCTSGMRRPWSPSERVRCNGNNRCRKVPAEAFCHTPSFSPGRPPVSRFENILHIRRACLTPFES